MKDKPKRNWWPLIITMAVGLFLIGLMILDYQHLVQK